MATGNCKVPRNEQPQFGIKLFEEDVRLIYNAVDFYLKNRPGSSKRPEYMQEPTAHLDYIKQSMMTLMMEASYQQNK